MKMQLKEDFEVSIGNGVPAIQMVWVSPRRCVLGSPEDADLFNQGSHEYETPFTLTKGYWISKYPISELQYSSFLGNTGIEVDHELPQQVTWRDAIRYTFSLTKQHEAMLPQRYYFSLPTEVHWEIGFKTLNTIFKHEKEHVKTDIEKRKGHLTSEEAQRLLKQFPRPTREEQELCFYPFDKLKLTKNYGEWCFEPFHLRPYKESITDWGEGYEHYFDTVEFWNRLLHLGFRSGARSYTSYEEDEFFRICLRPIENFDFEEPQFNDYEAMAKHFMFEEGDPEWKEFAEDIMKWLKSFP